MNYQITVVMVHAQHIAQVIVVLHVETNAMSLVLKDVEAIVGIAVRMVAQPDVRQLVRVNAKKNAQRPVPIVALVTVQGNALQLVLIPVRLRHHNIAQIVPATVLLDALLHVLMLAKLRHHKDVLIVRHNVVEIVSMNVPTVVDVSATHRVVVNAKVSVAEHAR